MEKGTHIITYYYETTQARSRGVQGVSKGPFFGYKTG